MIFNKNKITDWDYRMQILYFVLNKKYNKKVIMQDKKIGLFATLNFDKNDYFDLYTNKKDSKLYKKLMNINNKKIINFSKQIQLKKELYAKNKNIEDDELRKKNFKQLRQIQNQLNNKIDCFNSLDEIKQTINKEVKMTNK